MTRVDIPLLVPDLPGVDELVPYLRRIDEARRYTNRGPLVTAFERACGTMIGGGREVHCITAASGTLALEIALRALALPPGSRLLVPSFTFPATAIAVARAGHRPVLCDVDDARWVLTAVRAVSLASAHACIGAVPVAAFGAPLDVDAWDRAAQATGLAVVADGAGAFGSMPAARNVTIAYSLHATKPLGIGEGGLIATPHAAVADRARILSNYGFVAARIEEPGTNAKLSEYGAAVGLAQLDRAAALIARRRSVWDDYRAALCDLDEVQRQQGFDDVVPCNLIVRIARDAGRVHDALSRAGIETRRWYFPPLHHHPAFADLPRAGPLDVTERLARHALGLPFHSRLSRPDVERVVQSLATALRGAG